MEIKENSKNIFNRKLKILIADDEKSMIDEIISNLDIENEDYEIIGYAISNEEEIKKIEELKPDIVITDIFRGSVGNKNAGGYEIIKEYSDKYFLPKFMIISYTPDFNADNIVGKYEKRPNVDYKKMKKDIHIIKTAEIDSFMRGYEKREKIADKKEVSFIEKFKSILKKQKYR